jgi:hypothetical protein
MNNGGKKKRALISLIALHMPHLFTQDFVSFKRLIERDGMLSP